jgi:hypothetical protein
MEVIVNLHQVKGKVIQGVSLTCLLHQLDFLVDEGSLDLVGSGFTFLAFRELGQDMLNELFLIHIPGRVNVPVHILPLLIKLEELTSRIEIIIKLVLEIPILIAHHPELVLLFKLFTQLLPGSLELPTWKLLILEVGYHVIDILALGGGGINAVGQVSIGLVTQLTILQDLLHLQLLGFILLIFHVQGHLGLISSTQQLELEPWNLSQQATTTNLGPEAGSLLLESWEVLGLTRELGALNISFGGQVTFKDRHLGLLGETSLGTLGDTFGILQDNT